MKNSKYPKKLLDENLEKTVRKLIKKEFVSFNEYRLVINLNKLNKHMVRLNLKQREEIYNKIFEIMKNILKGI